MSSSEEADRECGYIRTSCVRCKVYQHRSHPIGDPDVLQVDLVPYVQRLRPQTANAKELREWHGVLGCRCRGS